MYGWDRGSVTGSTATASDRLDELAGIARWGISSEHAAASVERILSAAREHLGMDVAFISEFQTDGCQYFRHLEGEFESFYLSKSAALPIEQSPCSRMAFGRAPNVTADAKQDERINDLDVVHASDIGAYVGVPLQFSDGRFYGTMCCLSHSPEPELRERDAEFMRVLARLICDHLEREDLELRRRRLEAQAAGTDALLAALDARDGYTGEHSRMVVELSTAVAREMGLSEAEVADVEQAALLHDIGKIGVPDAILNKPGSLSADEWRVMRRHPTIGARLVSSIEGLAHLAPIIRAEHERWDGKGYPDGLREEEIPLASRIVFACDAYHAMTSDRPYRKAISYHTARAELEDNCETQFCPVTVRVLLEALDSTGPPR